VPRCATFSTFWAIPSGTACPTACSKATGSEPRA
jgi:hypothetical protein